MLASSFYGFVFVGVPIPLLSYSSKTFMVLVGMKLRLVSVKIAGSLYAIVIFL